MRCSNGTASSCSRRTGCRGISALTSRNFRSGASGRVRAGSTRCRSGCSCWDVRCRPGRNTLGSSSGRSRSRRSCWPFCRLPPASRCLVRGLEKAGTFSYSIYIVHLPVFVLLTSWLFNSVKPDSILYSIGFFFIALGVAYAFHLLVERPVLSCWRACRRGGRGRSGRSR